MTYYSTIVAWSLYYLGASFMWPFPWASGCDAGDAACMQDPQRALPLARSTAYFMNTVIQFEEDQLEGGHVTAVASPVFGCALPLSHMHVRAKHKRFTAYEALCSIIFVAA